MILPLLPKICWARTESSNLQQLARTTCPYNVNFKIVKLSIFYVNLIDGNGTVFKSSETIDFQTLDLTNLPLSATLAVVDGIVVHSLSTFLGDFPCAILFFIPEV